jgi:hypothetical protein
MKSWLNFVMWLLLTASVTAQEPFVLHLQQQSLEGLPTLQSFAAAQ